MWWHPGTYGAKIPYLLARRDLVRAVRGYFDGEGFLEVETPALQVSPGMEPHIHAFKTALLNPERDRETTFYLHTSPEFAMKKLLVAGLPKIYQICHVYRNAEGSRLHSPEFSMIEWYRANAGYRDIMDDCVRLLRAVADALNIDVYRRGASAADPFGQWEYTSVCDAFERYAGFSLLPFIESSPSRSREGELEEEGGLDSRIVKESPPPLIPPPEDGRGEMRGEERSVGALRSKVQSLGLHTAADDSFEDLVMRVLGEVIEPKLGQGRPTILYDYPVSMAALSRPKPEDPRFAERFELYVCGVELANAFGELTDAEIQRRRFEADMALKEKIYGERWPVDEDFLAALEFGMPESGGIALGIDRLVMLATGADSIEQVLWIPSPPRGEG